MKNLVIILMAAGLHSAASAGTMVISGLPATVNTSAGPVRLLFDIVSNGQLDNDSIFVGTYEGGTLDISDTNNIIIPYEIYLGDPYCWDPWWPCCDPWASCVWADIAIPKAVPDVIEGDIISNIGLTIAQGFVGTLKVEVLSENSGRVEDVVTVEAVTDCFPHTPEYANQYADYIEYLSSGYDPTCWCNDYGTGNQCYGDAAGDRHLVGYYIYTTDLARLADSWKARLGDSHLDPCADFDHKAHARGYRVYTGDLRILSTNWKAKNLPGDCPITDAENDAR